MILPHDRFEPGDEVWISYDRRAMREAVVVQDRGRGTVIVTFTSRVPSLRDPSATIIFTHPVARERITDR